MAVPGLTGSGSGWFEDDGPLRPIDLQGVNLQRLFDETEAETFAHAFAPGADRPRALPEPRSRAFAQSVDAQIADSIWKD